MPLFWLAHEVPSHLTIAPLLPTAQMLFAPVPHAPLSELVVGLTCAVQAVPSQRKIAPPCPTIQTLLASTPQIPFKEFVVPIV